MKLLSYPAWNAGRVLFCLLSLVSIVPAAHAAVGRTRGVFAVSPTGAASYTVPIWAPPGPNGLQPSIALNYNSQAGNGVAGVGWALSGLSSIYRCNQTFAQDGAPAPVTLASSDGLCLDGKRLRLTSGTYGQAGSTYQTEVADFSSVTAYGSAGSGPAFFVVKDRNGTSYFYGYGAGSNSVVLANGTSTALSWLLSRVSDAVSNTETISYTPATGTAVPSVISWTPTSYGASTYQYTMTFRYGTNVAVPSYAGYAAGTTVQNPYLLSSITIAANGTVGTTGTLKNYVLSYQAGPVTGRNQLTQVQECADTAGSNCLQPTQFRYQSGGLGVGGSTTLATVSAALGTAYTAYDLNGDGINDLAWYDSGSWKVSFGGVAGFSVPINTGITAQAAVIDNIDGSGTDSFLAPVGGVWQYYKWGGSGFVAVSTGVAVVDQTTTGAFALADLNEDGLPDLITTGSDNYLYVRLNTSTGGSVIFSSVATKTVSLGYGTIRSSFGATRRIDLYGSGQHDLVWATSYPIPYSVALHFNSANSSFVTSSASTSLNPGPLDMADFNDDGCTDMLFGTQLVISPCNGTAGTSINLPTGAVALAALDWDGDGRRDILAWNGSGSTAQIYLSNGTGFNPNWLATSIPVGPAFQSIHNPTGDGQDGLVALGQTAAPKAIQYYLHNGAGQSADLLNLIIDGYGNLVNPSYVSIAQTLNNVYFAWNNASYPYQNYLGPLYVVNQVISSDPNGTPINNSLVSINGYQQNYYYAGAWTNVQGRGFAGFGNVQLHDSRNGVWLTRAYGQPFPYTGLYQGEVATQNNTASTTLWTVASVFASAALPGTPNQPHYFPYASSVTRQDYELGSGQNRVVKTTSTSYSYDSYGNPTTIATTLTDKDSSSPYYGNTWTTTVTNTPQVDISPNNWCLSLFSQTQVVYTSNDGGTPITRTSAFTPDTSNCRYTQIVTEPSNANLKVTESLSYDSFGNPISDTVTGVNMAGRATTLSWGATGQFPMTVKNALGQQVTLGYDFGLGMLTSQTDPNNLTTSFAYDGFGRKTQEKRPDGTSTTFILQDCTAVNFCSRNVRTLLWITKLDKNGAAMQTNDRELDSLERPYQAWNKTLNSASSSLYSMVQTNYDTLGRVVGQSAPCLTSNCNPSGMYFTSTQYDVLNRPVQISRPTSANNSSPVTSTYKYGGDSTTITDFNGHARTLVNDPKGLLRRTTDATGYSVILAYDAAGSQTVVTDSLGTALGSATYQYGVQPEAISRSDADLGTWRYSYDALGEVIGWTDPKNQHFTAAYDAIGRQTDRYEPDLYTHWTWGTNAAAHEIGQLSGVCTGTGTNPTSCTAATGYAEAETYDMYGRRATRAIQIPGDATYTYGWSYDGTTGLLDTLTYPADRSGYRLKLKYGYAYGLLSSIIDVQDSNLALWTAAADNERLQFTQETLGNGVVVNHSFDPVTGLIGQITAGVGGGATLQNNSYLFDAVGNLIQRQDNSAAVSENVYVDALNRLSHTVGDTNTQMSYDAMGRLATWQAYGNTTNVKDYTSAQGGCSYYSNSQPHAVRRNTQGGHWTTFCYDANGNTTQEIDSTAANGLKTYQWASYNQPALIAQSTAGNSSQFFYDHNHQRWKQIASYGGAPEITEYIGGQMERMQNATSTVYRYYVTAGNNTIVVTRPGNGTTVPYYLTTDHLGSTALVTNQSGVPVAHEKFAALGWNESSAADQAAMASITRHEFTGQEGLDNLWLVNMNGRIYDFSGSMFKSPDPTAIHDPTRTVSYNRYAYAGYNPLRFVDPSGFEEEQKSTDGGGGDDGDFGGDDGGAGDGGAGGGSGSGGDGSGSGGDGSGSGGDGGSGGGVDNPSPPDPSPQPPPEVPCPESDPRCTVTVPGHQDPGPIFPPQIPPLPQPEPLPPAPLFVPTGPLRPPHPPVPPQTPPAKQAADKQAQCAQQAKAAGAPSFSKAYDSLPDPVDAIRKLGISGFGVYVAVTEFKKYIVEAAFGYGLVVVDTFGSSAIHAAAGITRTSTMFNACMYGDFSAPPWDSPYE